MYVVESFVVSSWAYGGDWDYMSIVCDQGPYRRGGGHKMGFVFLQ